MHVEREWDDGEWMGISAYAGGFLRDRIVRPPCAVRL